MNEAITKNQRIATIGEELLAQKEKFAAALPEQIPVIRFLRVLVIAIQRNPELLDCDRASLWNSAMQAATDGLLPDGREGAIIVRKNNKSPTGKSANWQPMIGGIRKKARNSGEIATWDAQVVCEGDDFSFQHGDAPEIKHSYDLRIDRGPIIGAYSVCRLKDGFVSFEIMSLKEIHKIRDTYSDGWKAYKSGMIKSTPWSTAEGEMAKKTVARRHAKSLPTSTDLDDLIRRSDEPNEAISGGEAAQVAGPKTLAGKLDALAAMPAQIEGSKTNVTIEAKGGSANVQRGQEDKTTPDPTSNGNGNGRFTETKAAIDEQIDPNTGLPKFLVRKQQEGVAPQSFVDQVAERLAEISDNDELSEAWLRHVEPTLDTLSPEQRQACSKLFIDRAAAIGAA
jgi:phage RecT family recombinase